MSVRERNLKPHFVYVVRDVNDTVIYVGMSSRPKTRLRYDRSDHIEVLARMEDYEILELPNKEAAMLKEKELIKKYEPTYNQMHKPGWRSKSPGRPKRET